MTDDINTPQRPDEALAAVDPLADLRQQNTALHQQLAQNGKHLDPDDLLFVGLQTLVDLMLPVGGPFRHIYELQRESRLNETLQQAVSQVLREKLTEGVITP